MTDQLDNGGTRFSISEEPERWTWNKRPGIKAKQAKKPIRPKPFAKPSANEPASSNRTERSSLRYFGDRSNPPFPQRSSSGSRKSRPTFCCDPGKRTD